MTNPLPPAENASAPASSPARLSHRHLAALGVILAVAAFVRFFRIAAPSLWMDEIWSIEISTGRGSPHDHLPTGIIQSDPTELTGLSNAPPWWNIWTHMNGVTHPPLYHVVLRWWMDCFSGAAGATRSLSAVLSLAAIMVFFDLCRLLHGPGAALTAAALMAAAGAQIDFAQETRSYPMLILLVLCCADMIVRIQMLGISPLRLTLLAVAVAAASLTHYFAAWALLAMAIYMIVRLRGCQRMAVAGAMVAGGLIAAALWGPWFFAQLRSLPSFSPDFLVESGPGHLAATLHRAVELPAVYIFGQATAAKIPFPVLALAALLIVVWPALRLRRRRDLLLWVLWIVVPIGGMAALDLIHGSAYAKYVRYSMLASPAAYALLAANDTPSSRIVLRNPLALAFLVLAALLAAQRIGDGVPSKEDWRNYAAVLDANAGGDDLLVFYNDSPWISPGMWYMNFKYYVPGSQRPWLILDGPAPVALLTNLQSRHSLWLVGNYPQRDGPMILPGWQSAADELREPTVGGICHMTHP